MQATAGGQAVVAALAGEDTGPSRLDTRAVPRIKTWLTGISPMVCRRVLVSASHSLRELHGVFQVVMGWEGIRLHRSCLRAKRHGSAEPSAASPDVTLADL